MSRDETELEKMLHKVCEYEISKNLHCLLGSFAIAVKFN
jgi:hypothetical protein